MRIKPLQQLYVCTSFPMLDRCSSKRGSSLWCTTDCRPASSDRLRRFTSSDRPRSTHSATSTALWLVSPRTFSRQSHLQLQEPIQTFCVAELLCEKSTLNCRPYTTFFSKCSLARCALGTSIKSACAKPRGWPDRRSMATRTSSTSRISRKRSTTQH